MATMLNVKTVSERLVQSMMDAVMGAAIIFFGLSDNKSNFIKGLDRNRVISQKGRAIHIL